MSMTDTRSALAPAAGPLRIAVAGAGIRAQVHLTAIKALPGYWRLAGICDVQMERAAAAGRQFGAPAFDHPLRLLDETRPDALFIVVPPDGHHPLALAAAERGVHVITEVPISISLPLADLMIDACARHGVVLEVAENSPRSPRERVRQEVVRRGLLGPPTLARLTYTSGSYHGIGAVCELLGGMPAQVWGWRHDLPVAPHTDFTGLQRTTHDWEFGVYRWPPGEAAGHPGPTLLYESPPRPGARNYWEIIGPRGRSAGDDVFLVVSREGRLSEHRYTFQEETTRVHGTEVLARLTLPVEPPVIWENPLLGEGIVIGTDQAGVLVAALQLVDFYQAVVFRKPLAYGATRARRDIELLIALRESAYHGSVPVPLPLRVETDHERWLHELYRRTYSHDPLTEWREALETRYPRGGITHGVFSSSSNRESGQETD